MRDKVEAELGGLTLFLQGAAANINPDMLLGRRAGFEKVTETSLSVADAVLVAADSGRCPEPARPVERSGRVEAPKRCWIRRSGLNAPKRGCD